MSGVLWRSNSHRSFCAQTCCHMGVRLEPSFQNSGCWQLPLFWGMQGALCQPYSLPSVFWNSIVHTQFTQWLGLRVSLPFRYLVSSSPIMEEEQRSHGGGGREKSFVTAPSWRMTQWLPFTVYYYCGPETMKNTLCRLSLQSSHEPWKLGTIHLHVTNKKVESRKEKMIFHVRLQSSSSLDFTPDSFFFF